MSLCFLIVKYSSSRVTRSPLEFRLIILVWRFVSHRRTTETFPLMLEGWSRTMHTKYRNLTSLSAGINTFPAHTSGFSGLSYLQKSYINIKSLEQLIMSDYLFVFNTETLSAKGMMALLSSLLIRGSFRTRWRFPLSSWCTGLWK